MCMTLCYDLVVFFKSTDRLSCFFLHFARALSLWRLVCLMDCKYKMNNVMNNTTRSHKEDGFMKTKPEASKKGSAREHTDLEG